MFRQAYGSAAVRGEVATQTSAGVPLTLIAASQTPQGTEASQGMPSTASELSCMRSSQARAVRQTYSYWKRRAGIPSPGRDSREKSAARRAQLRHRRLLLRVGVHDAGWWSPEAAVGVAPGQPGPSLPVSLAPAAAVPCCTRSNQAMREKQRLAGKVERSKQARCDVRGRLSRGLVAQAQILLQGAVKLDASIEFHAHARLDRPSCFLRFPTAFTCWQASLLRGEHRRGPTRVLLAPATR